MSEFQIGWIRQFFLILDEMQICLRWHFSFSDEIKYFLEHLQGGRKERLLSSKSIGKEKWKGKLSKLLFIFRSI